MRKILPILYVVLVAGAGAHCDNSRITNFFSRILIENRNNVVYLITDCDPRSLSTSIQMIDELEMKHSHTEANTITTSLSENVDRPMIFAKNLRQLSDGLKHYVCAASITYEGSLRPAGGNATILRIIEQMHNHDVILLVLGGEHESCSLPALTNVLKGKEISINVIWSGDSDIPEVYTNTATNTKGRIFVDKNSDRQLLKTVSHAERDVITNDNSNYEMTVFKSKLEQDTRTVLVLPQKTFQIFLTINGDVKKALLIPPSGIVINVTPEQIHLPVHQSKASNIPRQKSVTFKCAIDNSPATWVLSSSGSKYDIILITLINRKTNNSNSDHTKQRSYINTYNDPLDTKGQLQLPQHNNLTQAEKTPTDIEPIQKRQDNLEPIIYVNGNFKANALTRNFLVDPIVNSIPTIIDVDPLSTFFVFPTEEAKILFNVRNNKPIPNIYYFDCYYLQQPCFVVPRQANLNPQQRVQVLVTVRGEGSEGSSNILSLISRSTDLTDKKVYVFIGKQISDNGKPDIEYEYNGNCDDANAGNTCHKKRWSANLYAQDRGSGLLNFYSEPMGLVYTSEFIVGTRDQVPARYSATCCNPKVDVEAVDLKGNTYRVTLNIEHQFLSTIEIIAIVLGIISLVLIIAIAVYCLIRWRRQRNEASFLSS